MKNNYNLFLNIIHGFFLGFILGMMISILALEFFPEIHAILHPAYIFPILSFLGGIIGYIKGIMNYKKLFSLIFSTGGTIITPILAITLLYFFLGLDRLLALPPIVFKSGIGLREMDTRLSSYIFTSLLSIGFILSLISSQSINKKNRWTY